MKNRHQSQYDFLVSLQKEYIIAQLRKKIYPIVKSKRFFERTMEQKRIKIEDIADRNKLQSIFSCNQYKIEVYRSVIPDFGIPMFFYRDDDQYQELRKWDIINYFAKDSEVKIKNENTTVIGYITDNQQLFNELNDSLKTSDRSFVEVKIKGSSQKQYALLQNISRIL